MSELWLFFQTYTSYQSFCVFEFCMNILQPNNNFHAYPINHCVLFC